MLYIPLSACYDSNNNPSNFVIKKFPSGKFLELFDADSPMRITDYSQLKRKILFDNGMVHLGAPLVRDKAGTVDILRKYVEDIINIAIIQLKADNPICFKLDFSEDEKHRLINQLIWDVLFDTYSSNAKLITYSEYVEDFLSQNLCDGIKASDEERLRKSKDRTLAQFYTKIASPQIQHQLECLGVSPAAYMAYFDSHKREETIHKRPKFIWDMLYYNRYMITYRQYRRQLSRDTRNYPYKEFIADLKEYGAFVGKILPKDNYSPQVFVERMIAYYCLETYKRIDWMLQLASFMYIAEIKSGELVRNLIKPFHPEVLALVESGDNLMYFRKIKYYRPPMLMEYAFISGNNFKDKNILSLYSKQLQEFNIVRAKAFELLKLHVEYGPIDYHDIKKFIINSYDIRVCHNDNDTWYTHAPDLSITKETKAILNNVIELNSILFPASTKNEK